ncbi:uncharacterized protein LOC127796548 [Diospyros lotus]|uniref:uncharacterized protein LOC127796548 n=1 Tax=Diospyros lotus TaxID=55363 RepID=UPI0022598AF7|nr:uncharacterized protein LOC127796548 [Diospyros lotus]
MAVDVCFELPSLSASPRISFSRDLNQSDGVSVDDQFHLRSDASLLDPTFDFAFSIGKSFAPEISISSADELFSNGKILPTEIKKHVTAAPKEEVRPVFLSRSRPNPTATTSSIENLNEETKKKRLKEFLSSNFDEEEGKPLSKPFWQFRRSSSLNCESGRSKALIRSLQFLSRSNSTGSAPNPKQPAMSKDTQKQHSFKQAPFSRSQSCSSSNPYYPYNSSKRPPLKKNCRSHGNGVRISPVLNIPHNCIAAIGTATLFGFGSLFCNGKAKKKKK